MVLTSTHAIDSADASFHSKTEFRRSQIQNLSCGLRDVSQSSDSCTTARLEKPAIVSYCQRVPIVSFPASHSMSSIKLGRIISLSLMFAFCRLL